MSLSKARSINIAILALGGQGGGVLVDWIVGMAEHAGWTAQATSVAGVAQRTGATIYYVELVSPQDRPRPDAQPVLALMAVPGDVDVLIAAELMEAGRAVQRGLVTPDRTTLIASSHRIFSVMEKTTPGNGLAESEPVAQLLRDSARQLVLDDMQALAVNNGSVISASLFGALAGSGALPFAQADFESVVERSGVGVKGSLAALRAAAELARQPQAQPRAVASGMATAARPLPEKAAAPAVQPLLERIRSGFPAPAWNILGEGLARVLDYQDVAYGTEYLDRVATFVAFGDTTLVTEAAHWIAVAMSYDDVVRVADLKTRPERWERVRREVGAGADEVVGTEEFFHPRLAEVLGLLPLGLARWVQASPALSAWLAPRLDKGRRIRAFSLRGHMQLRLVAGLRRWRRGSLRHAEEMQHLQQWLDLALDLAPQDAALAAEVLRCRRLVKGYSDTHARGSSRFDRLMRAARLLQGREDAAIALASLRDAALSDAEGKALAQRWTSLQLPASA
ncbi:indolepyruvate oxidoreductase subunit beta family protein [Hydrogenophaga sp.]|uniref:indolepyruvate oxidoreductase subunit beta family protein n=1 Tax=Hydrogenophaga sp. TaxID=1904254 RepID=UPI00286DEA96|nr:indolepyruvate oxidoreductase subunit beta family protein [Hydrogenophaga sp.]